MWKMREFDIWLAKLVMARKHCGWTSKSTWWVGIWLQWELISQPPTLLGLWDLLQHVLPMCQLPCRAPTCLLKFCGKKNGKGPRFVDDFTILCQRLQGAPRVFGQLWFSLSLTVSNSMQAGPRWPNSDRQTETARSRWTWGTAPLCPDTLSWLMTGSWLALPSPKQVEVSSWFWGSPIFRNLQVCFDWDVSQKFGGPKKQQTTVLTISTATSSFQLPVEAPAKWLAFLYTARSLILAPKHRLPLAIKLVTFQSAWDSPHPFCWWRWLIIWEYHPYVRTTDLLEVRMVKGKKRKKSLSLNKHINTITYTYVYIYIMYIHSKRNNLRKVRYPHISLTLCFLVSKYQLGSKLAFPPRCPTSLDAQVDDILAMLLNSRDNWCDMGTYEYLSIYLSVYLS